MITPIGGGFGSLSKRVLGLLVGYGAVLVDFALTWEGRGEYLGWRLVVALVAVGSFRFLLQVDRPSLGLRLNPVQGWPYWIRATCWIGVVSGACMLLLAGLATLWGLKISIPRLAPSHLASAFLYRCVLAPLVEETTYRVVLCPPTVACFGPAVTIAVSGFVFAMLHVVYGNSGLDNAFAGFILGWAYLKSGTILVPMILHSLGNLLGIFLHIAVWYAAGPATG